MTKISKAETGNEIRFNINVNRKGLRVYIYICTLI